MAPVLANREQLVPTSLATIARPLTWTLPEGLTTASVYESLFLLGASWEWEAGDKSSSVISVEGHVLGAVT
jgi:hypothetical protein